MKSLGEVRRLTDQELQQKREKGIYFRCDDKWSIGHRCRKRDLSVLLTQDDEYEGEIEDLEEEKLEQRLGEKPTEVSLNSVVGLTSPKTMKLVGRIGEQGVIVMIDPGATHNFISVATVEKLGLPVTKSKEFGVSLGNGEAIRGTGECKGVRLKLEEVEIWEDFLPLKLGNSDLILGVQWLEKLGTVVTNWKTQTMKFQIDGTTVTLKGDPSLARSEISLKAMIKMIKKEKGGILVEVNEIDGRDKTEGQGSRVNLHQNF